MNTIINFYKKAKANENLCNFYQACAAVEMDEYRDYEKAIGAMKEAKRLLDKAQTANKEMKMRMLDQKISNIEQFIEARTALQNGDGATMVRICSVLVDTPGVNEAIRLGDVFS
jgi:intraflagellar transport protein 140